SGRVARGKGCGESGPLQRTAINRQRLTATCGARRSDLIIYAGWEYCGPRSQSVTVVVLLARSSCVEVRNTVIIPPRQRQTGRLFTYTF
ncbi:MAG: hypothetical protein RMJ19_00175, partial [Gemmatales bacterium]|nr:hypothetical protein [Gemmatales bacterium]MDW8174061.1 hypothetical protein [Gemmatales bacterium]